MIIIGIDPGLSGAIVAMDVEDEEPVAILDTPHADGDVSAGTIARWIRKMAPEKAYIEKVAARPGQGVSSMFKFGASYGTMRGVCGALGITLITVTPQEWKKFMRIPGKAAGGDKRALALARATWPDCEYFDREKDHNRADAALIAHWAIRAGRV